jgi:hypothetical protein
MNMLKSESVILLSSIKNSLFAVIGIITAFLVPIIPLILIVGGAIILDTVFGVYRSFKLKESITSRKLSRLISKMVLYQSALIGFFCIEKFILDDFILIFTAIPLILTKLVSVTLIFIEAQSINENWMTITGVSIWKKFKELLYRSKELNNEFKELSNDINNEFENNKN